MTPFMAEVYLFRRARYSSMDVWTRMGMHAGRGIGETFDWLGTPRPNGL